MRTKLYKKWVQLSTKYALCNNFRMYDHGFNALKYSQSYNNGVYQTAWSWHYSVALALWKYSSKDCNLANEFRYKWRKRSKKYWEPEAVLKRIIKTGSSK